MLRRISILLLALCLWAACLPAGAATQKDETPHYSDATDSAPIADGWYTLQPKIDPGKSVTFGHRHANGVDSRVMIATGETRPHQLFFLSRQPDNTYRITCQENGKVLDVRGGSTESGAQVWQYKWNASDAQRWYIVDCGEGWYRIVSQKSRLFLDVKAASTEEETLLQIYYGNDTDAQKFALVPYTKDTLPLPAESADIKNGWYTLRIRQDASQAVTFHDADSRILLSPARHTPYQQFGLARLLDDSYRILCRENDKSFDVRSGKKESGAEVWQYKWNGSDAQRWYITACGGGWYQVVSRCAALPWAMDDSGKFSLQSAGDAPNQRFCFVPVVGEAAEGTPPQVTFTPLSGSAYEEIQATDARLSQEITFEGGQCTEAGLYLYAQDGAFLAAGKADPSSFPTLSVTISSCGYTLAPSTGYRYAFYALIDGVCCWSEEAAFTTLPPSA